ncbi:hypothetical protein L1987_13434 [Smallanthus sonchifolius]|uniref:Uncharacterized protein n=1 Tax=Smallanthus sonchifolius TaxID=185202 RepID=A0ACB9JGF8_9ASTR|nr:hypothetical protein L1987_13434 [Smallanthus sonchifolius]
MVPGAQNTQNGSGTVPVAADLEDGLANSEQKSSSSSPYTPGPTQNNPGSSLNSLISPISPINLGSPFNASSGR